MNEAEQRIWGLRLAERVPPEERLEAAALTDALCHLVRAVEDFRAALDLWDVAGWLQGFSLFPAERYYRWQKIALRDGVIILEQFSKALSVGSFNVPSLRPMIDRNKLRAARKRFDETFSRIETLRNSVLHRGQMTSTAAGFNRHSVTKQSSALAGKVQAGLDGGEVLLPPNYVGRTLCATTEKGEVAAYELSQESLAALRDITGHVLSAFDALAQEPRS